MLDQTALEYQEGCTVARLNLNNNGPEESHREAEAELLNFLDLTHPAVADAFRECKRRNGWWYA